MHQIEGSGKARGVRFAVVVSRYHDFVTDRLQAGALAALDDAEVVSDDITVIKVPGAFEIPLAAQRAAGSRLGSQAWYLPCRCRSSSRQDEAAAWP